MYNKILVMLTLFVSMQSIAHGGHNHSDPMAGLVHLVWIAPFVIGAIFMVKHFIKRASETQSKQKGETYDV